MGDRATVLIKYGDQSVSLYTHNCGSMMPEFLKDALKRKQRWDDAPYLARIIFCRMIQGYENGDTGFGIWTGEMDGVEFTVDVAAQTVDGVPFSKYIEDASVEPKRRLVIVNKKKTIP